MQKNRMWDSVWMGNMHNFLHLIGFMSVIATRNIKGSGRKDDGDDGRAVVDDCEWRRPESLYICSLLVNDGNEVALNWLESQTSNEDPLQGGLFHRKRGRKRHRWSVVLIYICGWLRVRGGIVGPEGGLNGCELQWQLRQQLIPLLYSNVLIANHNVGVYLHFVCLAGGITITCRISFITPYRMRCYLNKDADVIWGYPKCEIMSIKPEEQ